MAAPSNSLPRASRGDFTVAEPGGIADLTETKDNTWVGASGPPPSDGDITAVPELPIKIHNTNDGPISAYIIGFAPGRRSVFILQDGTPFYPTSGGSTEPTPLTGANPAISVPAGETVTVSLKIPLDSARVYFSEKEFQIFVKKIDDAQDEVIMPDMANAKDPHSDIKWGFSELTYTEAGVITANVSFVDVVGLPLGATLDSASVPKQVVQGLPKGAVQTICGHLDKQQEKDQQPWKIHCVVGADKQTVRVLSPFKTLSVPGKQDFAHYFDEYIDKVWARYSSADLTFNLQTAGNGPMVPCRVQDDGQLHCQDDPKPFPKPTTAEVWGCSGVFGDDGGENPTHRAIRPRLCAAFVRSTLLLEGGNVQPGVPATSYYTSDPTSHYSRIIHVVETDGKGYAFPFDDVNPQGPGDASGLVSAGDATALTFSVGG